MSDKLISIFWDESFLWGLLVYRALKSLNLNFRLVNSFQIKNGILEKNFDQILITPGGSARLKAGRLEDKGLNQIRKWVAAGGCYLGICGGAGLALANPDARFGIGLCPIKRADFADRMTHFFSGAVMAKTAKDQCLSLPIWWPGRFDYHHKAQIGIMAAYDRPGEDLWLGDGLFSEKCEKSPENVRKFPAGEPLIIGGAFEKGKFVLSYSHLETPGYGDANKLLTGILQEEFSLACVSDQISAWNIFSAPEYFPEDKFSREMFENWFQIREYIFTGAEKNIFSTRYSWLYGWRQGFPGIVCHFLLSFLWELASFPPNGNINVKWRETGREFQSRFSALMKDMQNFMNLWLKKAEINMDKELNGLKRQIFGHPVSGGGECGRILKILDNFFISASSSGENKSAET